MRWVLTVLMLAGCSKPTCDLAVAHYEEFNQSVQLGADGRALLTQACVEAKPRPERLQCTLRARDRQAFAACGLCAPLEETAAPRRHGAWDPARTAKPPTEADFRRFDLATERMWFCGGDPG